jgi:mRNA-degrading endonuclease RelE of RelBE toxin-antitoxin system
MRYAIVLSPEAVEDLEHLKANSRASVREAIETHLRHSPTKVSKSRIKRLRGLKRPQYRLRIDDIRVYYDVIELQVEIIAIISKSASADWLVRVGDKE